jgi:RimJ/RimL family protein N-acetyltransferase
LPPVKLSAPDNPEQLALVAEWLARKENHQWLDFGDGRQVVGAAWLKIAMQRGSLVLRVFTCDERDVPIGVVGLSGVNRDFRTATLWIVLGDKSHAGRGYATRAVSAMLTLGFEELGLHSINTWIVEHNPSIRVAERVKFRPFGRQRQCHFIDGRPYDRLWFDLLASEHCAGRSGHADGSHRAAAGGRPAH